MLNRIIYRFKQLFFALSAKMSDDNKNFARHNLNIKESSLFFSLPEFEQKHAVVVAHKMIAEGKGLHNVDQRKLVRLGLLHDIGKSAVRMSILDKGLLVITHRLMNPLYDLLAGLGKGENSATILRQFYVHKHHGLIGSRLLEKIGESHDIIDEVARHDDAKASNDIYMTILGNADSTY